MRLRSFVQLAIPGVLGSLIFMVTVAHPVEPAWPGNVAIEVNPNAVLDGQIRVCDQSSNLPNSVSTYAVTQWNEAIGSSILTSDCSTVGGYRGVTVTDVGVGQCGMSGGQNTPACAQHPFDDNERLNLYQKITPEVPGYSTAEQQTIAVHELGHNLGFDHYNSSPSIMHEPPLSPYLYVEPQAADIQHYTDAYTVLPPTSVSATSPVANQVKLTWNQTGVWNEQSFTIFRKNPSTGSYDLITFAPQNATGITLNGEPAGTQYYRVGGFTNAGTCLWGFCFPGPDEQVNVLAPTVDLRGADYDTDTLTPDEGDSDSIELEVENHGSTAAPGSYVAIRFNGQLPSSGGICFIPSVPPKVGSTPGTASCTTAAVTWDFRGGPISVEADYGNAIGETNESNNTASMGQTLAVRPNPPVNYFIAPPFAAYGYDDRSNIETGFGIKVQRRAGSCGSSGWSTFSQPLNAPLPGDDDDAIELFSPVAHGYCYRVKVTALGQYGAHSPERTSDPGEWYP